MTALLLLAATASHAAPYRAVAVSLPEDRVGVAYAAGLLGKECGVAPRFGVTEAEAKPSIRAGLVGGALVPNARVEGAGELSDEGYAWAKDDSGLVVVAEAEAGLMYGLLELAERLHNEVDIEPSHISQPFIKLRGDYLDLPFYLGCDLYDGRWSWSKDIEGSPDSWFHDREHWTRVFQAWARRRMNHVMLQHPHPFPAFITYPESPEAAYLDGETVARNAESLQWIIDEGAKYGISFSILIWNEWVPRDYAEAHGIRQEGPGTPESAALNRHSYGELFRRFPGLSLVTMAGESPPGCIEFVRDNVVKPLAELPQPPKITYWTWCSYPEDVNTCLDGYPGETAIMHYLQYEQLFKPMVDPRVGRMSRECGGRPVVAMGGLGTATGQLYWGDPFVIRDIIRDAPGSNVEGIIFCGLDSWQWASDKWLGWEGLARYWWDPSHESDEAYWERRIADELGDEAFGKPLLSAYRSASAVPMRMLCLLHSQSDVFRPQYGNALVFYLGMPTLSTYVFENHTAITEQGRLSPRMGLTWPNPKWGEEVVGVVDYVAGKREGTTPLAIADELAAHADTIREALDKIAPLRERCSWGPDRFDKLVGVLTMNELLARHVAAKIHAAVAWQEWHTGRGSSEDVLARVDESVAHWRGYAQAAIDTYGRDFPAKRNILSKPPPWTHMDLWVHYRYEEDFTFLGYADRLQRERELIAASMAEGRHELPYEPDLLPPVEGDVVATIEGGQATGGFALNNFPPRATAKVVDGRVLCDHQGGPTDFYFPFVTKPEECRLEKGVRYEVIFRFEILRTDEDEPLGLSFGGRTTEGTWRKDVGVRWFGGPAGTTGEIRAQLVPEEYDDYYIYLSMNGSGTVAVEDVRLIRQR